MEQGDVRVAGFEVEPAPEPLLRWETVAPFTPLAAAIVLAVVVYWPVLASPFFGDDYVYLRAARDLSWGDYLAAALTPHSNDPVLLFNGEFYRPLYFLSFKILWPVFGSHVLPYHLLLLGIHLSAVVLTWLVALRLFRSRWWAGCAALLFAVHPAGVDSVSWISGLNIAATPLMLASWLALIAATDRRSEPRWSLVALCVLLLALALGFRETAIAMVPILAAWYLLIPARARLREWRTYVVLVPIGALVVGHSLLRTRFFTEPFANEFQYRWGWHMMANTWTMLRWGPAPFLTESVARELVSGSAGVVVVAIGVAALLLRRWLVVALWLGYVGSLGPFAPLTFGLDPRYFYFAAPFFALLVTVVLNELWREAGERKLNLAPAAVAAAIGLVAIGFTQFGNHRTTFWVQQYPDPEQRWVEQLHEVYPTLPEGGTLYCVNTPLILALFGGFAVPPTVIFLYPQVADARYVDRSEAAVLQTKLGPNDRIFAYQPERAN